MFFSRWATKGPNEILLSALPPKPKSSVFVGHRNLTTWFAIVVAIQLMIGVVIYRSIHEFIQDAAWVTHTQDVSKALSETLATLVIGESAMRGYLVTGQQVYLDSYRDSVYDLTNNIDALKVLVSDDSTHRAHLPQLGKQIRERFAGMEHVIALRQRSFEAALGIALTGLGKEKTDQIRALISMMEMEEARVLAQRRTAARNSARLTLWLAVGGVTLSLGLLSFMSLLIWRENTRRLQVETELRESNARLNDSMTDMQRMTLEMALLNAMGEMLQACSTTEEAYEIIDRTIPKLLPNVSGSLSLLNGSQEMVELVMQWGSGAVRPGFARQECWAMRQGRVYALKDPSCEFVCSQPCVRFDGAAATDSSKQGAAPQVSICTPLLAYGDTLGVLSLTSDRALTTEEERVARIAGEQISLALANLRLLEKLRAESIRDPLTALFNRRYMDAALDRELTRAKRHRHPVSLIMIDIDHFKDFNDIYGHDAGDGLLVKFAELLKQTVRAEDITCRYGGEEFMVILPEASLEIARQRAEELRARIKDIHYLQTITASFGVAVFPDHGPNVRDVIRASDTALYRAKREGRDRVVIALCMENERSEPLSRAS